MTDISDCACDAPEAICTCGRVSTCEASTSSAAPVGTRPWVSEHAKGTVPPYLRHYAGTRAS
ncbi:uncharacterized protein TRAVEDRAFT_26831 [Trametes versicolor FP-101664 SS1]|uniref:uncharacterized protein n=1 Tax=Trametes versicolor (strain FP-101664) TaxID=717944 RepID=UPI0004622ECB|nr:uncharacterized protein TRAVEDRAFT_26831 [Trametes versicolor FP-101664 SS1]EIW63641.1 hypothetical protein TRAVEDRAFT_26831 [Trametes versicolor FP-101664 SS1]